MQKNLTDAVIVHCIDFRLQAHLNRWLDENVGTGNFDRVALAGGVREFETVFKQIQTAERLHEVKHIILVNHEDCGAYGAEGTFERHNADLHVARERIRRVYPDLRIKTLFLYLDGKFKEIV